jgi:type II secretory pathway component PulK
MTRDDFRNLLDAHGADASRWPSELREHAAALIGSDAGARADLENAPKLDAMLARFSAISPEDELSALRVMGKLNGPLPRQKQPFWRVPAALLDWQFAPAWPRLAALAGCMLIGFTVGIAGVDRTISKGDGQVANRDIGAMVFAPEIFAGDRE